MEVTHDGRSFIRLFRCRPFGPVSTDSAPWSRGFLPLPATPPRTGRAVFPHPALQQTSRLGHSRGGDGVPPQPVETQTRQRPILALSRRTAVAPLAPAVQMRPEPISYIPVHPAEDPAGVTEPEVIPPSPHHRVHFPDHLAHRLAVVPACRALVDVLLQALFRFCGGKQVQILP